MGLFLDELNRCFSGGCDPAVQLNQSLRGGSRHIGSGLADALQPVIRQEVDYLFDKKVEPLLAKVDQMVKERIRQGEDAAKRVVDHTLENFAALKDELKEDVEDLLETVDAKIKENLKETFERLSQAVAEVKLLLRALIGEIDAMLEKHITRIALIVMRALAEIKQMALELIHELGKTLREDVIMPAFDRLDRLEDELFRDLDRSLENFVNMSLVPAKAELDLWRQRFATHFLPQPLDPCHKKWNVEWKFGPSFSDVELYGVSHCQALNVLEAKLDTLDVEVIAFTYGQLQADAWIMLWAHRGAPAARDLYLKDWVAFGRLSRIWADAI